MIEELIFKNLINWGVLGLWTGTLLLDKYKDRKARDTIIKANTEALTKINQTMQRCPNLIN